MAIDVQVTYHDAVRALGVMSSIATAVCVSLIIVSCVAPNTHFASLIARQEIRVYEILFVSLPFVGLWLADTWRSRTFSRKRIENATVDELKVLRIFWKDRSRIRHLKIISAGIATLEAEGLIIKRGDVEGDCRRYELVEPAFEYLKRHGARLFKSYGQL